MDMPESGRYQLSGISPFEKYGYDAKDDLEHRKTSSWHGRGAEALRLRDNGACSALGRSSRAKAGNGQGVLGHIKDGERDHRSCADMTIQAPKSVSLAALAAGDSRINGAPYRNELAARLRALGYALGPYMVGQDTGSSSRAMTARCSGSIRPRGRRSWTGSGTAPRQHTQTRQETLGCRLAAKPLGGL